MSVTILDGGISRELQRLGAPFRQPEWSALALIETPHLVAQVHDDFAVAGAQVISTNSYAVVPFHIGEDRFAAEGPALAARAGQLAREVADRRGIRVAASLPPVLGSYRPDLFEVNAAKAILEVLIAALSPTADIWLAETLSTIAEGALIADLLAGDERPLWLSFTLKDDGEPMLRSGETIAQAAALAKQVGAGALLFNCSAPEVMEAAVAAAKAALGDSEIAIGVYANGFAAKAEDKDANVDLQQIRADLDPPRYLDWAQKWIAAGATMVGGCCGIGAAHIAALSAGARD
ncbi:MAG: homocysteine S-methyltransferase family protein [Sphingomonadaceae bacterium]